MQTVLVSPSAKHAKSWREALDEFESEDREGFWNIPSKPTNIEDYVQRVENHAQGIDLPGSGVPSTTFWLIDDDRFIGHINIRHELNERLERIGGNIGYAIRPSERNKGYGAQILALALPYAMDIGLKEALITCDNDNIASQKIILRNGGVFTENIEVEGRLLKHYKVVLTN